MSTASVLVAERASRLFRNHAETVTACRDVDLTVGAGEFVVVRGRSGAGKTTLLDLLAGLIRPTSGRVEALGVDLGTASESRLAQLRREQIATIPQDFGLIAALTAEQNVAVPLRLAGTDPALRDDAVAAALAAVGLAEQGKQRPDQLSGGQQQRVAIARALVLPRPVVLADEPTGSLDSTTGAMVIEALRDLARSGNSAVVVTTHDPAVSEQADRVFEIHDGTLRDVTPAPTGRHSEAAAVTADPAGRPVTG